MTMQSEEIWSIIIDTDSYSGNFEREMGSYITGKVCHSRGDLMFQDFMDAHGVNRDECDVDWETDVRNPFSGLFQTWPDDELAHCCPTPGWRTRKREDDKTPNSSHRSIQIRCYEKPTDEQVKLLKEWVHKFAAKTQQPKAPINFNSSDNEKFFWFQDPIQIIGFRLTCARTVTEESDLGL